MFAFRLHTLIVKIFLLYFINYYNFKSLYLFNLALSYNHVLYVKYTFVKKNLVDYFFNLPCLTSIKLLTIAIKNIFFLN